jgi:hypothetical protein
MSEDNNINTEKVEICLTRETLLEIDLLIAECHESDIDRSEVIETFLSYCMQSDFYQNEYVSDKIKQQKSRSSARNHESE